jgi:hypothetical protein
MLRIYSAVLRLCASLDAMLQGLMCMLDFVAIASFLCLQFIILFAFAEGFLGVAHKRRLQREGHSLLGVLRGETP